MKWLCLLLQITFALFANPSSSFFEVEYLKHVDEITRTFINEIEKKHNLHCYGSGGSMSRDVEKIDVKFLCYAKTSVNNAREMEVNAIQTLLQMINTHEKIKPYLREYPFQSDRVGVSISFRTETDGRPLDGSVAYVSTGNGKIFYYTAELQMSKPMPLNYMNEKQEAVRTMIPGTLEEKLIPLMEEPYEEALKIVQKAPT